VRVVVAWFLQRKRESEQEEITLSFSVFFRSKKTKTKKFRQLPCALSFPPFYSAPCRGASSGLLDESRSCLTRCIGIETGKGRSVSSARDRMRIWKASARIAVVIVCRRRAFASLFPSQPPPPPPPPLHNKQTAPQPPPRPPPSPRSSSPPRASPSSPSPGSRWRSRR
jgi:hypothetical protein